MIISKKNDVPVSIEVAQSYLETARSIYNIKIEGTNKDINDIANISLALTSISTIYSYMAVESFINRNLYNIWKDCQKAKSIIDENSDIQTNVKYPEFCKKYLDCDDFKKLKDKKYGLSNLKKRIKEVCKARKIKNIYDVDNGLWADFLHLVERARHFLIHPYPDPKEFAENMDKLLIENELKLYPQIAEKIIKHFYDQLNETPPEWLEQNKLFKFNKMEIL